MKSEPDLYFAPSSDSRGFPSSDLAMFRDKNPAVIVRELIQNSLDASSKLNQKTVVHFYCVTVSTSDIPSICAYKQAFIKAVEHRKEEEGGVIQGQEKMIIRSIENALKKKEQSVLVISDNGVGLDKKSMDALLSDGISRKETSSSGAFGVGHLSVFPASNLRYILYGGISNNGEWIASGHAILASHYDKKDDQIAASAHGYYRLPGPMRYRQYPTGRDILPAFFARHMDSIQKKYGHGTAIIVPGFNQFRNEGTRKLTPLESIVAEAVACNFFAAVEDDQLEVLVEGSHICRENLVQTMEKYKDRKRSFKKGFLSGNKAYHAHSALINGKEHRIPILDGEVKVRIQHPSLSSSTHVNLCRNGMWITNADSSSAGGIPGFYNKFNDLEPFEAVILVSAKDAPKFHDLIREAEGPVHVSLDLDAFENEKEKEKQILDSFREIKTYFSQVIPKISSESIVLKDYLVVPKDAKGKSSASKGRFRGMLSPVRKSTPPRGIFEKANEKKESGKKKRRKKEVSPKPKNPLRPASLSFSATVTPLGPYRKRISITSTSNYKDIVLRLVANDRADVTTESIWGSQFIPVTSATINDQPIDISNEATSTKLHIGTLQQQSPKEIILDLEPSAPPAFNIQIEQMINSNSEPTKENNS